MSYDGEVIELPMLGGLTGTRNQALIRPDQLIVARNVSFDTGTIRKEGGALKYNSSAISGAPTVIGGWDWNPSAGVQRMVVVLSDGTVKKDSGAGTFPTTLASGLTVTDTVPTFVEAGKEVAANNRKLYLFTGKNAVQILDGDGATMAAISTPPADWTGANQPTCGANHEGRVWGAGNANDPHRVYYSTQTNHSDYTGAGSGSLSIYPGEGERITGLISFKGLLVIWKYPRGVYFADTTDPTIANWKIKRITTGTGGVSPQSQILIDNDVMFLDAAGNFQLLSATQEFGNMLTNNLSQKYQINTFLRDNINMTLLSKVRGIYYGHKREALFVLPTLNSQVNNCRMVCDFNGPEQEQRFIFRDRDVNECIFLRTEADNIQHPCIGDNAGFIYKLDQTARNKDGSGYLGTFQTPHIDFNHLDPKLGVRRKMGRFLEVVTEPTGNWNMAVDIMWDGVTVQTVQFNMGVTGVGLGTFVIGTDQLGADALSNRKRRIVGEGRRFSLVARNSGANEDFSIARFYLHFKLGNERLKTT